MGRMYEQCVFQAGLIYQRDRDLHVMNHFESRINKRENAAQPLIVVI